MSKLASRPWANQADAASSPQGVETAWDALERFIRVLRDGRHVPEQYRNALSAIREATEAEIVFLCNDQTGDVLEAVGDHVPSPQWYHQFTRRVVDEFPRGGIWKAPDSAWKHPTTVLAEPSTAIALPVETPRPSWLVALRFRDCQTFLPADLRVVRVIWQLQLDHNRHDRVYDNLKETLFGVVRCLSTAIDAKDSYTSGHSERVARIAVRLGEEMGLGRGEISDLYLAGLLHDVGKIGIRDEVLRKEGPLTPEEFLHIQEHPVIGERIIANVTRLAYLRPGVRGHHERMDGKGYPDGLSGDAIPRMARILAVADACDAMMSMRRYRAALSQARIEEIFKEGSGTQWDPRIIEHFFSCRHELYAVIQRGLGQSVYMAVERAVGNGETQNRQGSARSIKGKPPSSLAKP
jgi:HD-GYP domain-containing protein (c-di-GMP phosphodiesterase class II)